MPAGSQSSSQPHFPFTLRGSRQQKICQVDAGNQKHHSHDGHHHGAGQRHLIVLIRAHRRIRQGRQHHAAPAVVFGIFRFQLRGHGLQQSPGRFLTNSGLEPANRKDSQKSPVVKKLLVQTGQDLRIHARRNPDLFRARERECPFESLGGYSDHGVRPLIQRNGMTHDGWISGEAFSPQCVADDDDALIRMLVFG